MNKTPHSTYKIRFSDCDLYGHLNNARYLDYMLNAREDHLLEAYGFDLVEKYKLGMAWLVGSNEIIYTKPAAFNEIVSIRSTLISADDYCLHVEMQMFDKDQRQLKAIMRTKFIPVNPQTGKKDAHKPEFVEWANTLVNEEIDPNGTLQQRVGEVLAGLKTLA